MAQIVRTVIDLIDDINGHPADETIEWALDGQALVMDLTAANAAKFRRQVEVFRKASRPARAQRKRKAVQTKGSTAAEIRAWAKSEGLGIRDTGLIARHIREAYDNRDQL